MKPRKPLPRRKAYIARGAPPRKLNPERAARRRDAYQAHLRSAHFRWVKEQVRERSGGRCERTFPLGTTINYLGNETLVRVRCPNPARHFNHTSYAKVPHEPPEHVEHLCDFCNDEYEGARPWRAARRQALSRAEKAS